MFILIYVYFNLQVSNIVYFLQGGDPLKFINLRQMITSLPQPNEDWFQATLSLYGMKDLCMIYYIMVNHMMLNAFIERWNNETSSFHPPLGDNVYQTQ